LRKNNGSFAGSPLKGLYWLGSAYSWTPGEGRKGDAGGEKGPSLRGPLVRKGEERDFSYAGKG